MPTITEYTVTRVLAAWNLRKPYVCIRTKVSDTSQHLSNKISVFMSLDCYEDHPYILITHHAKWHTGQ